jgi:CarD family transcriptional regulator
MPSVKKIETSRKAKAAIPEAKSPKQRSSKPSRSKTASKPSRAKTAAKTALSKQRAKATPVAKKKATSATTTQRRSEARKEAPAKRRASAAKVNAAAKPARAGGKKAAPAKAGRAGARSAPTTAAAAKLKQTSKKTAARIKRQEKSAAAAPQTSRKKAASESKVPAKVVRRAAVKPENMTAERGSAAVRVASNLNIVSESVLVLPAEPGPTSIAAKLPVLALEATTITLETGDHQSVTQKIQKKTVAASTPVAELRTTAEKVLAAAVQLKQASVQTPVKAAVEKNSVTEAKLREANAAVAPTPEIKPAETAIAAAKPVKATVPRPGFKTTEFIVYPAHGVGQIIAVEEQEVAGFKLELFVISFVKDKMILKVPVPKATSVGMRKLGSAEVVKKALNTLTGRARVKRTMWSRRAQEYEAKINSGDLVAIAEVVRDLYRSEAQPEQSYSERQLYEAALDRVAREISVVQKLTETESLRLIEGQLQRGPRRGKTEEAEGDVADEGDIEEAA